MLLPNKGRYGCVANSNSRLDKISPAANSLATKFPLKTYWPGKFSSVFEGKNQNFILKKLIKYLMNETKIDSLKD